MADRAHMVLHLGTGLGRRRTLLSRNYTDKGLAKETYLKHRAGVLLGPEFRNGAGITDPDGFNFPWINFLNPS